MLKKIVSSILVLTLILAFGMTSFADACDVDRAITGCHVVTTAAGLNARTGPGTNYGKVYTIPGGSIINIDSFSGNWGHMTNGYWVSRDYISRARHSNERSKIQTPRSSNVYLRKGPSTSFGSITKIPSGTIVERKYYADNGWSYIKYGNTYGWASSQYVLRLGVTCR